MTVSRLLSPLMPLLLVIDVVTPPAFAGFDEMTRKLPPDTNAMIAVNVREVLNTPLAQEKGWKEKWADSFEYGTLTVPPQTIRLLGAAKLKRDLETSDWQISLMETDGTISLSDIAQAEAGYTDKIWDKMAITTPGGAFFIQLAPTCLAGYQPVSNRASAVRWVRESAGSSGPSSPYLQNLGRNLNRGNEVVIGIDLDQAYSASDIRRNMQTDPFAFGDNKQVDLDVLSQLLASIQNVTLQADITDKIQARVIANFGIDAALLEFYAKPILTQILGRAGMSLPEVEGWTVKTSGKQVMLEGELSGPGLRSMLQMFTLPSPNRLDATSGKASADPKIIGEASRKYFRAVNEILQQYSGRRDYSEVSRWLAQSAQRISKLPIINVDPELVAWGNDVASRMRQVATGFREDQQTNRAKVMGISANNNYYYDYDGNYNGNGYGNTPGQSYQSLQNQANQQSQQLAQSKADSISKASQVMGDVLAKRDQLRIAMTQKYKIQF